MQSSRGKNLRGGSGIFFSFLNWLSYPLNKLDKNFHEYRLNFGYIRLDKRSSDLNKNQARAIDTAREKNSFADLLGS